MESLFGVANTVGINPNDFNTFMKVKDTELDFLDSAQKEKLNLEYTKPEFNKPVWPLNRAQTIGLFGGLAAPFTGPFSIPLAVSSGVIGGFGDYQMYKEDPKTITPLNIMGSAAGIFSVGDELFSGWRAAKASRDISKANKLRILNWRNQGGKLYGYVTPKPYDIHGFKGVQRPPFPVFENPTTSEFHQIMKASSRNIEGLDSDTPIKGVRVAVTPDGKVWAWDALAGLHGETIDLIYGKGTAHSAFGSAMAREEILDPSEWNTFLERLPEIKKSVKWDYETRPLASKELPKPLQSINISNVNQFKKQRGSIIPVSAAKRLGQENSLDIAKEMKQMVGEDGHPKYSASTIAKITGWHKAPDGQWKFEIPDAPMKVIMPTDIPVPLTKIMDHPELFKAMPELKDVLIKTQDTGEWGGWWDPSINTIVHTNLHPEDLDFLKSSILHETTHAIASKTPEWSRGIHPDEVYRGELLSYDPKEFNSLQKQSDEIFMNIKNLQQQRMPLKYTSKVAQDLDVEITQQFANYNIVRQKMLDMAKETYERALNEVEARTVANRGMFTKEDIRRKPFFESYTKPYTQIVLPKQPRK